MDEQFQKALDFANYQSTFSVQKRLLQDRLESRLTFGYGGGLFKIDYSLIVFVQMLINDQRTENIQLLDSQNVPVMINDLVEFKETILDKFFTGMNEYMTSYSDLKSKRSVEKIIEV